MERDEIHELIMFLKEELRAGTVILRSERTMASHWKKGPLWSRWEGRSQLG
jgi:hypothetical protein